jgi:hypothetical protein
MNLYKKNPNSRKSFQFDANNKDFRDEVKLFHRAYLGKDGLLMMHFIKSVAGDVIFVEILDLFWQHFKIKHYNQMKIQN